MSEEEQRQFIENLGKLAALAPALSIGGRAISGVGSAISGLAKAGKALSSLGIGAKIASLFGSGAGASAGAGAGTALGASIGTSLLAGLAAAVGGGAIAKLLDNYVIAPILELFGSDSADWYKNFHWFGEGGFFDEIFDFNSFSEAMAVWKGALDAMFADIKGTISGFLDYYKTTIKQSLDFIGSLWDTSVNNVKNTVTLLSEFLTSIWDTIKNGVQTAWDTIGQIFADFKDGVFQTFQDIFDKIKGIWDSLGELFQEGFDIKLPHITVSGGVAPYGIGGQGSLPKFNIDWYANGGILTNPTIFGMQGGHFLGGGEAGAEAVLPLSNLQAMITEGMTQALGSGGDTVINVSIDNNNLGSVLLTAQQMMTLRRGK